MRALLIVLFFISCIAAIGFMFSGNRTRHKWLRKSFYIYGTAFFFTAASLGAMVYREHQLAIRAAFQELFEQKEQMAEAKPVLTSQFTIKDAVKLDAPLIRQLPELPRGCEITSLAMLLGYHGIHIDKMDLAKEVRKNPAKYEEKNGKIYFGNPHNGFVGDMHSFENPGLGVYHEPIAELAAKYAGDRKVRDLTGHDFTHIMKQLNHKRPVWVIINATYKKLPDSEFITWQTEDGPVKVTKREHSVLITGYDEKYVYFNDPLDRTTKAPLGSFKDAWEQMGKQAITIL